MKRSSPYPDTWLWVIIVLCAAATLSIAWPGAWLSLARDGVILAAGGWLLLGQARRRRMGSPGFAAGCLLAVAAWSLVQVLFQANIEPHTSLGPAIAAILSWLSAAALTAMAATALSSDHARHRFLEVFAWFAVSVALLAILLPALPFDFPPEMAGPFQNRNTYCSFVELALPVLFWRAQREPGRQWLWWSLAGLLAATVIRTGSRAGAGLLFAELVAIGVVFRSRKLLWAPAALVLFWSLVAGPETLLRRLQFHDPLVHRREIMRSAAAMIAERPLLGFGPGSFRESYPAYASFDVGRYVNHVHNDWLEWAVEGGVGVPAILLLLWGRAALAIPKAPWATGLVFVFLHSLVDYPMQRFGMAGWVWLMLTAAITRHAARVRAPARESTPPQGRSLATAAR